MTKRYKALKDLIGMKAGDVLEPGNGYGDLYRIQDLTAGAMIVIPKDHIQTALEGGWIEETDEVDSWPKEGDDYWFLDSIGGIHESDFYNEYSIDDTERLAIGNIFKTKEEAEAHVRYLKALTRVKGSSSFVPDWDDSEQTKYYITYNHAAQEIGTSASCRRQNIGIPVYYESREAAEQAIKDHKEDFLILAGVK